MSCISNICYYPSSVLGEMAHVVWENPLTVTMQRIWQSTLIQIILALGAIIAAGTTEAISLPVTILALGLLAAYACYNHRLLLSEVSFGLIQNQTRTDPEAFPWHSEITPGVILSAMPTQEHYNARYFKDLGVTKVISAVERTEITPYFFGSPETPAGWARENIQQRFIEAQDHGPLTPEQIYEAVQIMKDEIRAGGKVLVHCMAGKGRSASIVLAYLLNDAQQPTLEMVLHELRFFRPQICPNQAQQATVRQYYAAHLAPDFQWDRLSGSIIV